MMLPRRALPFAALATLVLTSACGTTDPEPLVPATLAPATVPPATAHIADTTRVVVRVLTASAEPVAGQVVDFTLSGPGTLTASSVTSDARGYAGTTWILGTTVGLQQLVARVGTLPPLAVVVDVAAGAPASLTLRAGNDQTAAAGTAVSQPPSVVVRDVAGNPVPGVRVVFVVTGGGGRLTGDTATTDAAGVATVGAWTLGTVAGPNALAARIVGTAGITAPSTLTVTLGATAVAAPPARISAVSPLAVTATVGTELAADVRPTVAVADAFGNRVPGATVSFSTIRAGVTSARTSTTDVQGIAVAPAQVLDTLVGVDTMSVTAPGTPSIAFVVTRRPAAPVRVWATSGDRQVVAPGAALPEPLVVQVTDQYRNPIAGVSVTFEDVDHVGIGVVDPVRRTDAGGTATSGTIKLAAAPPRQRIAARAEGVATAAEFATVPPPEPATRLEWRWYPEYWGVLTTQVNQRTKPVSFALGNDVGNVAPTQVRLEVIPSYAGTVYVFEPGAVVARSEITATANPEPVVQVLAYGFVGSAILRATLPNGSRYDLPFYVAAPPKP